MVYGDFISCFPELHEYIELWSKEDKSDMRKISVVYIPQKGSHIKRRKYTSGNTSLDIVDQDVIYVHNRFLGQISVGDYFYRNSKIIWRVTGELPYDKAGDFIVFSIETVTGATPDQQGTLPVKEAYFA